MRNNLIKYLKKYAIYILISIIIILIIIIGFIYSNKTTEKIDNKDSNIERIEEIEPKQEKITYKVDIKGEIKKAGVYELDENARVIDVINMAGGLTKDAETSNINLSKKIKDEMVIIIYSKKEIEEYNKKEENIKEVIKYEFIEKECVCPNTLNDACIDKKDNIEKSEKDTQVDNKETEKIENDVTEEKKLVNLNTATKEELLTLSGIGEAKALSIIEYRKENKFETIEDIKNISGIGDSLFEKIKDYITV